MAMLNNQTVTTIITTHRWNQFWGTQIHQTITEMYGNMMKYDRGSALVRGPQNNNNNDTKNTLW